MRRSPPRLLETVVGFLIPPACREPVLGDLHERYVNTMQYLADVTFAVPCVIVSRIRRMTDPLVLLTEALALYLSFLAAAWALAGTAFLHEPRGLLRLAIPAAVALGVLVLADAYVDPRKRPAPMPLLEATMGLGVAAISQAALWAADPSLVLPRWILITGGGFSVLLVSTLRMLFPPTDNRPRGAT